MMFNSVTFLIFLVTVVSLYWILPLRPRLWLIFLSSCVFYGFWRVEFVPLLLASTLVDYVAARGIAASQDARHKRFYLIASLAVNLGFLFFFKYLMFAASNVTGLLQFLGLAVEAPRWSIVLPLGISFYTFQTISYTVDVYRGAAKPERDFVLYACYVTYFPQLVAGPILRAREVIYQLQQRPPLRLDDFQIGIRRLLFGLFLKVVLADNIAPWVDDGFAMDVSTLGAIDIWTLAMLFGFQVYFDFSAYSHIALGCARMMGIRFPENFNFPFLATSPQDFWARWHISLSSWVRDYLYLPLLGMRGHTRSEGGLGNVFDRGSQALFLSWILMGFWHGANWTFVFWGFYHAVWVWGQRQWGRRIWHAFPRLSKIGAWPLAMIFMTAQWPLFRSNTLGEALARYGKILDPTSYFTLGLSPNTYLITAMVLLSILLAYFVREKIVPALQGRPAAFACAEAVAYSGAIGLVFVFLRPIQQFIYFQF